MPLIICWGCLHDIALNWIPLDLIDVKSKLIQVLADDGNGRDRAKQYWDMFPWNIFHHFERNLAIIDPIIHCK